MKKIGIFLVILILVIPYTIYSIIWVMTLKRYKITFIDKIMEFFVEQFDK